MQPVPGRADATWRSAAASDAAGGSMAVRRAAFERVLQRAQLQLAPGSQ
jgi:hypothetical protein